jgi:N-acetylmuramoyl-L-alanine amidase
MMRVLLLLVSVSLFVVLWPAPVSGQPPTFDADVGLDAGHSHADVGASGAGLREFELTLDIALRARALLEARGYSVNMTRTDYGPLSAMDHPNSTERVRIEQEARLASVGRVRCYVSVHFNAHPSPGLSGTETYYNPENHGEQAWRLAEALQRNVVGMLWEAGYPSVDRGVRSDLLAGKPYGHFFGLRGPDPGALVEGLFLSNPSDAAQLWRDEVRQAIAEGYSRGISEYLGGGASAVPPGQTGRSEGDPNSRYLTTMTIASATIPPDIFDLPTRRSTNTIGTSAIR